MSQVQFLRDLDATIVGAFRDVGMADVATYTPPAGVGVICTVLVDRAFSQFGDDQVPVGVPQVVISLLRAEVAAPQRGGTVAIGAELFTLAERIAEDESQTRWLVQQ